jgi:hypothetical protein
VLGVLLLQLPNLRDRPSLARALLVGATCGVLALARSEQLALLVIVVAPVLIGAKGSSLGRRVALFGAAVAATLAVIAPWALYNQSRFDEPVLLSTNAGATLLAGNCPPDTYEGELIGFYQTRCARAIGRQNPDADLSTRDRLNREAALTNIRDHAGVLPRLAVVRIGRTLALFRPGQTVDLAAGWMGTPAWPIWAWVVSFWLLLPLVVLGVIRARRSRLFFWPLLAPAALAVVIVVVAYGEPRYHSPADLGLVVLAAIGADALVSRQREVVLDCEERKGAGHEQLAVELSSHTATSVASPGDVR